MSSAPGFLACASYPDFPAINPGAVADYIPTLLSQLRQAVQEVESQASQRLRYGQPMRWEYLFPPLVHINEQLRWSWGAVSHLNGVCNTTEWREAYTQLLPDVVEFGNHIAQSNTIFAALKALAEQTNRKGEAGSSQLEPDQERILRAEIRDMELRGVGLEDAEKGAFNAATKELAELSSRFGNQVLDATNNWILRLTEPSEAKGLPDSLKSHLAQAARAAGDDDATAEGGPWLMGLDMPRYGPFLKYSRRRDLRERVYRAHVSRASGQAEDGLNNWPLIQRILELRREQAQRLGYANWAEVSLVSKMANSEAAVEALLEELRSAAFPIAQQELQALRDCARRHGAAEADDFQPWDVSFWAEVLRQENFDLNSEALRPYFPLPQVLQGLFNLCGRLFDITIEDADGEAPIWHPDVRFFRVLEGRGGGATAGEPIAAFYLDPYSRPGSKRGGAWMDECLVRSRQADGSLVLPVAYLICNQSPPVGDTPSLMTFEEVETLFHEFGHGLQHMLTTVERPQVSGINGVEWDAVELPSQFMENWCNDRATLLGMARHWQTGEPLPETEFAKLQAARTFMGGSATLRQVHLALVDLKLHSTWHPSCGQSPEQLRRAIAATTTVLAPIDEDAFLCSFGHIFAGGYAAGYYSYKWAEVLSADAFSAFEEVGLENEEQIRATGRRFRDTVLSLGGSLDPKAVFAAFRGRHPSSEALIRHSGLVAV